jgi:hypothetical protein
MFIFAPDSVLDADISLSRLNLNHTHCAKLGLDQDVEVDLRSTIWTGDCELALIPA